MLHLQVRYTAIAVSVLSLFVLCIMLDTDGSYADDRQNSQPTAEALTPDEQKVVKYVMDQFAKSKAGKPNINPSMARDVQRELGITITPQMIPRIQQAVVMELNNIMAKYRLEAGARAPAFELPVLGGGSIKLADLKGKVVVVNFWATWCPPCLQEMPVLNELYAVYKEKGVEILGLSLDEKGLPVTRPFVEKFEITYPILESDKATYQMYGNILTIPHTYIIDRNGVIHKKFVGGQEKTAFETAIQEVL